MTGPIQCPRMRGGQPVASATLAMLRAREIATKAAASMPSRRDHVSSSTRRAKSCRCSSGDMLGFSSASRENNSCNASQVIICEYDSIPAFPKFSARDCERIFFGKLVAITIVVLRSRSSNNLRAGNTLKSSGANRVRSSNRAGMTPPVGSAATVSDGDRPVFHSRFFASASVVRRGFSADALLVRAASSRDCRSLRAPALSGCLPLYADSHRPGRARQSCAGPKRPHDRRVSSRGDFRLHSRRPPLLPARLPPPPSCRPSRCCASCVPLPPSSARPLSVVRRNHRGI